MGLLTTEYRMNATIKREEFTAAVPLSFSLIISDEADWTKYEEECAIKSVAVHILKKTSKEIQRDMERGDEDLEDYGNN